MRLLNKARLRLRSLFRRGNVEQELDSELRFHLDQLIEENIASGMAADEARWAALRAIGGLTQFQEECRDMRRMNLIDALGRDLRHAARVLLRMPGFTALAALTLALGIGATTAIFSVVYGVLLKPLPFEEPEQLVGVWHTGPGLHLPVMNHGPATYLTYRENQRVFEGIGGWDLQQVSITGRGEPQRLEALTVTHETLSLLRVRPVLGRLFSPEDDTPGSPRRVLLAYGYWQRAFGGVNDVVGQTLEIDGVAADIIGVLPPSFKFLRARPAVLLPMQLNSAEVRGLAFGMQALARLKPGVTLAEANADMARMIPVVVARYGGEQIRLGPNVRPLAQDVIGDVGGILWILLAAVSVVLLIACMNVANLFLVRAEARQQELAVRAALGASRAQIARGLLAESLMLGLVGGVIGLLFARAGIALLRALASATLPRLDEIALDPAVLLFGLAASLLSGFLFGMIPVLKLATTSASALKETGRTSSAAPSRHRTRNTLVVAEVAMALVLLILSGLMIRTFLAMRQVDPGFVDPEQVQTFAIGVPASFIRDPQQVARLHEQIAGRLRQVPGVASVGLSSSITMDGEDNGNPIFVEGSAIPEGELAPLRRYKSVAPGYFETMGNPLVAGRAITWSDIFQVRPVVIISEKLAREYWPSAADAIGKRVRGFGPTWYEIVGVSGNERDDGLNQPPTAIVYWPMLNGVRTGDTMSYVVRSTRVGAPGFLGELQQAVWSVNPNLPLANVQTLAEIEASSMAQTSFAMVMLAIAASVALLLGVVGIYAVIAYIATQRTREIGIRIALGAQAGDVRRLFLRHGLLLTGAGVTLGIGASLAVTRVLSALLFGVSPMDPETYAAVSFGLAAVAMLATYLPARRASRTDPISALRMDA